MCRVFKHVEEGHDKSRMMINLGDTTLSIPDTPTTDRLSTNDRGVVRCALTQSTDTGGVANQRQRGLHMAFVPRVPLTTHMMGIPHLKK